MEYKRQKYLECLVKQNFIDNRPHKSFSPVYRHDIITERDTFFSVRKEVGYGILRKVKFWGILLPDNLGLIDINNINKLCPNCIDGIYTNVWTIDGETWNNLYILSPNFQYPPPFRDYIDKT